MVEWVRAFTRVIILRCQSQDHSCQTFIPWLLYDQTPWLRGCSGAGPDAHTTKTFKHATVASMLSGVSSLISSHSASNRAEWELLLQRRITSAKILMRIENVARFEEHNS